VLILSGNFKHKNIFLALLEEFSPISLKSGILHPNVLDKLIARVCNVALVLIVPMF
jgi:hypothetical protein